jgi:hypothetical protein
VPFTPRLVALSAGALAVALTITGCSSGPLPTSSEPTPFQPSARLSSASTNSFGLMLAKTVAQLDSQAFDAPTPEGGSSIDLASTADDRSPLDSLLEPAAKATLEAQSALMQETSAAMAAAGVTVTETAVTPLETTSAPSAGDDVSVSTRLLFERTLNSGEVWSETVPYVTTVDATGGSIKELEVRDDAWVAEEEAASEVRSEPLDNGEPSDSSVAGVASPVDEPDADTASLNSSSSLHIALADTESTDGTDATDGTDGTEGTEGTSAAAIGAAGRSAAASYASRYALKRNGAYIASPNDCTNFISQALRAGGWVMVPGGGNLQQSSSVWAYSGTGPYPKTNSWADAQLFYDFAHRTGRVSNYASVGSLRLGDVLQYDVGTVGMNHTMMKTGTSGSDPLLSYHTNDTLNKPFSAIRAAVAGAKYYAQAVK